MSARPRGVPPVELSRHASEHAANRTRRWLEESREGSRRFEVEFNPMRDEQHPWRVLSVPYWSDAA